jgi:hypothetical protein
MIASLAATQHRQRLAVRCLRRCSLLVILGFSAVGIAAGASQGKTEAALKPAQVLSPRPPEPASAEERQLLRVEATSAITRGDEVRMIDDMLIRIRRMESTVRDLKLLIEAFPTLTATKSMAATGAEDLDNNPGNGFPVPLPIAAGIASLLLLIGLYWYKVRRSPVAVARTAKSIERPFAGTPHTDPLEAAAETVPAAESAPINPDVATPPAEPQAAIAIEPAATTSNSSPTPPVPVVEPGPPPPAESGYDQTLELAEIMLSMGLSGGAAQALTDHISTNPRQALMHWLKLLEIYRKDGHRADFDRAAREMQQSFNIQATDWLKGNGEGTQTLENFSRVSTHVQELWQKSDECIAYLTHLLEDNRDGMRAGFPQSVAEEMLLLIAVQKDGQTQS